MGRETSIGGGERAFGPTQWTVVLKAKAGSREALEDLLRGYWKPVYFFVRRWGAQVEDAKDLTQSFFADLLRRDSLKDVARERGRFRAFLLAAARNFLTNQADAARAAKRGGGKAPLRLDFAEAEGRLASAAPDPEDSFQREWALTVLERALGALQAELPRDRFAAVRRHLAPGDAPAYEETARELDTSVTDVKNLLHKARKRYRALIREVVRASVDRDEDVDDEVRDLFRAL